MLRSFQSLFMVAALGLSFVVSSAQGAILNSTIGAWQTAGVLTQGDKDFFFEASDLDPDTSITINDVNGDLHIFTVNFSSLTAGFFQGTGSLIYSVAINAPPNTDITSVDLDSDAFGTTLVSKEVSGAFGAGMLSSLNGAPAGVLATSGPILFISETFSTTGPTSGIVSSTNTFEQDFSRTNNVPEPTSMAIWGLVSIAGAYSLRRRKS